MSDDIDEIDLSKYKSSSRGRGKKDTKSVGSDEVLRIKEFDLSRIPPRDKDDKHGVKIVVIGKPGCFAPGTQILYYDGTVKSVEDVKVGDVLMGDDNTPRNVLELYHDNDEMFEINPKRGTSYTVNKGHALVLISKGYSTLNEMYPKDTIIEISVEEYLKQTKQWKNNFHCFRSSGITCWEDKDIIVEPYLLGVFIGDGTSSNIEEELKSMNLINNKHIPQTYKISSEQTRLELLAGIIDTDGYYDNTNNRFDIIQKNKTLAQDIVFVARSLGLYASFKEYEKCCMYKGEIMIENYYNCFIYGNNIQKIPTKIIGKQQTNINNIKSSLTSSFEVVPKGNGEYYGFSLDKNRKFLSNSFEVLRNTGKSTVIQDIVASKSHIIPVAQIFSGTEDSNHFYSTKMPGICVYNKLDMKAIENFVVRQKIAKQHLANPWALQIIDDCTDDPKILKKPLFQMYYKNGRHWSMMHILSLQFSLDISPSIRSNIDYTFILRETNLGNRERLHKNYANCIDNFADFQDIMDAVTEDYTALVIDNRQTSNKIEDCVFWYKADPNRIPSNWKFGSGSAWEFHYDRMDPNYTDPFVV